MFWLGGVFPFWGRSNLEDGVNYKCEHMEEPEMEAQCPYQGIDCVEDYTRCSRHLEWRADQIMINSVFEKKAALKG